MTCDGVGCHFAECWHNLAQHGAKAMLTCAKVMLTEVHLAQDGYHLAECWHNLAQHCTTVMLTCTKVMLTEMHLAQDGCPRRRLNTARNTNWAQSLL